MKRILLLETLHDEAHALLQQHADVILLSTDDANEASRAAGDGPVHAIVTRGKGRVTAQLMDACSGLVCVARCGVGLDNVDVAGASARRVKVLNLPGSNAATIAEHAAALMLAVARGVVECAVAVRAGDWASRQRYAWDEVRAKTVGIIGLGAIGSRFAEICRALGMTVIYTSPSAKQVPYERVSLDELLRRSEIISVHCPLTEATRHIIDMQALDRVKRGVILINTARGALIDQAALLEALRSGHVAGFGADVLESQPPTPGDPLLALPNVVITPHVGSLTLTTYREICSRSARNVIAVLAGTDPEPGCIANARDL